MSSNILQNSIVNNSKLSNGCSNVFSQSIFTTTNNNIFEENYKLFELTLEMAIKNDLDLPSKDKDFISPENYDINIQNNFDEIKTIDKIEKSKLEEIIKILSKYNN